MVKPPEMKEGQYRVVVCGLADPRYDRVIAELRTRLPDDVVSEAIAKPSTASECYLTAIFDSKGDVIGIFKPADLDQTLDQTMGLVGDMLTRVGATNNLSWEVFASESAKASMTAKWSELRADAVAKKGRSLLELASARTGTDVETARVRILSDSATLALASAFEIAVKRAWRVTGPTAGPVHYRSLQQEDGSLHIEVLDGGLLQVPHGDWTIVAENDQTIRGRLTEVVGSVCRQALTAKRLEGANAAGPAITFFLADKSLGALWTLDSVRRGFPVGSATFDEWLEREDDSTILCCINASRKLSIWCLPGDLRADTNMAKAIKETAGDYSSAQFISLQCTPESVANSERFWNELVGHMPANG